MAEATQITCPHCGQTYAIQPEQWPQYAGRSIACTRCGKEFAVGGAPSASVAIPPAPPGVGYATPTGKFGPAQETSGIAIAGLILGIVSLFMPIIGSIPAIICSAIGLSRTRDPRIGGRGLAIAGLVLGIISFVSVPCLLSILLPSLNRAREMANRVKCASNMRQIGTAMMMYANAEKDGAFPDSLERILKTQDITADVFICPSSSDTPATGATKEQEVANLSAGGHESYVYLGKGLTNNADSDVIVLYEPLTNHRNQGMNALFADGHVAFLGLTQAQQAIKAANAGERPVRVPNGLTGSP